MGKFENYQNRVFILWLIFLGIIAGHGKVESRAHHKVHNLALYPDKHSWCQAQPIRQEISHSESECHPTTIDNVVCLGACFSYTVPRAGNGEEVYEGRLSVNEEIPNYCDKCGPTVSNWKAVTLNCTRASTGEIYQMAKSVEIISNCSCVDCNDNSIRHSDNQEENNIESLPKDSVNEHNKGKSSSTRKHTNEIKMDDDYADESGEDEDLSSEDYEDYEKEGVGGGGGTTGDHNHIHNSNKLEVTPSTKHTGHGAGHSTKNTGVEDEDEDEDEEDDDLGTIPTLHKLKSDSDERSILHRSSKSSLEEEDEMINENKIPSDE